MNARLHASADSGRRWILVLMVCAALMGAVAPLPVAAAGMPVIDITAIAQAITDWCGKIQQYAKQISQWKADYERIVKAAKGIGSGDWKQVLGGLMEISSSVGSATGLNGVTDNISSLLGGTLATASDWENYDWSAWGDAFSSGNLFDDASGLLNGIAGAGNLVANSTKRLGNVQRSTLRAAQMEDERKQSIQKKFEDIKALQEKIASWRGEYASITAEDATKALQLDASIASAQEQIQALYKLIDDDQLWIDSLGAAMTVEQRRALADYEISKASAYWSDVKDNIYNFDGEWIYEAIWNMHRNKNKTESGQPEYNNEILQKYEQAIKNATSSR